MTTTQGSVKREKKDPQKPDTAMALGHTSSRMTALLRAPLLVIAICCSCCKHEAGRTAVGSSTGCCTTGKQLGSCFGFQVARDSPGLHCAGP